MRLEAVRPAVFQVRLHAFELSALIAAARWAVEGAEGELPADATAQLEELLRSYDEEVARLRRRAASSERR